MERKVHQLSMIPEIIVCQSLQVVDGPLVAVTTVKLYSFSKPADSRSPLWFVVVGPPDCQTCLVGMAPYHTPLLCGKLLF